MSGHSTEEVMELSLDVDSDDRVLPSDPDDYDYDYQEVLRIPPRVQGNFTDSSSDSGNSSDGNSDDDLYMQEQHIAQNFPDKPMTLVPSPAEYDEDFYNDWTLLENGEDTGHPDGLPPFTGTMATTVTGTAPMDYFDALLRDTIWGELAMQTNATGDEGGVFVPQAVWAAVDNLLAHDDCRIFFIVLKSNATVPLSILIYPYCYQVLQ